MHDRTEKPNDPFLYVFRELDMADQHLKMAMKPGCHPKEQQYYLGWCKEHLKNALSMKDWMRE